MNIHDLREAQSNFASEIENVIEKREKLHHLRSAFTLYFNTDKIANMCIDDFVIRKSKT